MADKVLRCAVYTRKSTEDGLEQEFNSLDAQYEACAAYAVSQRHEGWLLLPDRYDDGGFSGGNMQRQGLQRLLADVAAGKVDIILVYKIDRLTRSLADFAKIVEVLDKAGASFVSITQSFNTTTSMGRLTLNMLLSFAQFEREVTGERIRDKIAASKRKGMWMGGPVPLGYSVENRKLVENETEAKLVRHIIQRYLAVGSVVALADELNRDGYRTKVQVRASGPHRGGGIFRRGTLYHLLSNPIYHGKIVHKGDVFAGEHPAIVSPDLWEDVQAMLKANASGTSRRLKVRQPSLLVGKLHDGEGRDMTPSHTTKPGKRYRYYVTRPDMVDGSPAWRVSAFDLEQLVCQRFAELLCDQQFLCRLVPDNDADSIQLAIAAGDLAAATLRSGSVHDKAALLETIIDRINLGDGGIEIMTSPALIRSTLDLTSASDEREEPTILALPATKVRRGHQLRLIIPGPADLSNIPLRRDEKLVSLLAEARAARNLVQSQPDQSIASIAAGVGKCRTRLGKLAALACLAPDIVTAIVQGRQPASLTSRSLLDAELPLAWTDQRRVLGFI
ncbi:recombinase family protein [Croceicoccus ponticola]|uniref:Recombinase family protein n=1 Tax=Croceicoccus ponticola TaxID=2217664 RepID=A0A437GXX4_9SPHN|nr:recombinase family protein [Croceicoccus ponticola]RVQ67537.1 recombinase family protein [Croceicoccus ponticola]